MFGGTKPTFGTAATGTSFGGFNNTATSSPFGQSAFGKPATSAFGAAPSFGTQQTTPSLFGSNAAQPQTSGLFGGASTSTAFGSTTTTQPAFGNFSQPQQSTSIFGASQPQANTTSLFGQPSTTSAFGSTVKPAGLGSFGQTAAQPTTSLFGQPAASTSASGFGTFGQTAPTTTSVFGSATTSAFGQPANAATAANAGTSITKYQPTIGTDTLMKGGQPNSVNTKQNCITAMKEYESKSLEELRMEDYLANRKGPQGGATGGFSGFGGTTQTTTGTGIFGATAQPTGMFGQQTAGATENKGMFGSTASAFGQPATGAFGTTAAQPFGAKPFGAAGTTVFGAQAADNSNPFGAKPAFGQTAAPSLFGQTPASSTAPAFGQTNTGFGTAFGTTGGQQQQQQQQPSLFGQPGADANKPAFGLGPTSAGNTGFGAFGTTATSTATGGLFGAKPATGFGTTPAFGTSQANTGFQNFSLNNTNVGGGGLFNSNLNKAATTGFGSFGTNTSTAAPLNFNPGTGQPSLFGNTAAKPGGLFGTSLGTVTNAPGGGLFGQTGQSAFGLGNQARGFGQTGTDGSFNTLGGLPGMPHQLQQLPIHQQILSKVTSPYGDNPIFKDLKRSEENDPTRATNPVAQQVIMENTNNSGQAFKISSSSSPSIIKVKPIGSALTKKSLFEGLEEFDASVESFSLKPNAKRLILKPKNNNTIAGVATSQKTPSSTSNTNTPQRQQSSLTSSNSSNNNSSSQPDVRNESFSGEISSEPLSLPAAGSNLISSNASASLDSSRRESWLHPNNLEKVRQQNLNAAAEAVGTSHNNTLTELVPRKPLDTYQSGAGAVSGRLSVSALADNTFEERGSHLSRRETSGAANESAASFNRSYAAEEKSILIDDAQPEYEEHPTGITLRRVGYYTIPSMDDLKSFLAEDGSCVVPNFTVGREGYGNVYFGKEIDVAGLNLDEIVHFRNKEIIIYPDDDNKPPIGHGLNREAQVTLDQVWPLDKSKHESIKDPQRLLEIDWEGKLRRVCDKNETRFIEYRPETGSWVFKVKHFSKYGLNDSDEEDIPTDPKKAKISTTVVDAAQQQALAKSSAAAGDVNVHNKIALAALKSAQEGSEDAARALDPKSLKAAMDESAEFMLMDKTKFFQKNSDLLIFSRPQEIFKHGLTSPTSTLAKDMGTDAQKLQLMKASFFIDDDIDNGSEIPDFEHHYLNGNKNVGLFGKRLQELHDSSHSLWKETPMSGVNDLVDNTSEPSSQVGFNSSPHQPMSLDSDSIKSAYKSHQQQTETAKSEVVQKLPPLIVKPKVAAVKSLSAVVPLAKSVAFPLCLKWPNDLGLYNSRRFKLGFGPQITLIVPTTRNNLNREITSKNLLDNVSTMFKSRAANDYSPTILQHLKISATQSYDNFKESIVDHLHIQLRNSHRQDVEGSECPFIKSDCGTELIVKHLDEAIKLLNLGPLEEYAVSVWSLCLALWGDQEELENRDPTSHFVVMYRRNLISEWLENTLTDKDLLTKSVSKHTYLEHLLDLIMSHKVTEACELAFNYDDVNLSLLISQLSSGPAVRQLMEDQLAAWNNDEADKFIQVVRLKLFMLVAGISLMASHHGVINCLEGIEWTKVLALQLWYLCPATSSITDALYSYDKSFKSEEFYSLPPTPSYLVNAGSYNQTDTIYDLRYHLFQLFSKRSHPLESLLNPATHSPDPMDYRLSWLLLQTLEALGYRHCSELSESQLHVGFASQLENNELWEWSVFVLLHIKDKNQRELAIQNVLYKYVSVSKDVALNEKEKFVINNLGVPEKWIDYAKAVKAGSIHNYHLQAKYLLKAKQWSLAHDIIFQHIAPDAVINDNLDYLHQLLMQFENPDLNKSIKVPNWSNQGQIFLDFIDINEKFKGLKTLETEADIEAHWKNLKPQLADLCSRINLLPCPTSKHRLCQSEIAQNLACLVRGVLLVCPMLNPCVIIKIALERLPLPQEFAQQELRTLLDTLVGDLAQAQISNTDEEEISIK